jgi:hypothetical protein
MRSRLWDWWTRNWQRLVALVSGLVLVTVHVVRSDAAALVAGTFLMTLGLFIDRLDELAVGAVKAKLIRQVVSETTKRLETEHETSASHAVAGGPVGTPPTASVPLLQRKLVLPFPSVAPSRALASSSGEAGWISLRDVADARTTDELVKALANYAQPARRLSAERLATEREAMAAIMDLQAERASAAYLGENTPDEQEAADGIEVFWSHPEDMTDDEVRLLAALIRRLVARDRELGISQLPPSAPSE